ncbi:MAG: type II secretion system protein [Phycisphaerales bacterium JB040]
MTPAPAITRRGGFTLLETVIAITVIALLVALLLPSLAGVRDLSRQTRAASDLRQHLAVFSLYNNDYDDQYPYFAKPEASRTVLRPSIGAVDLSYFASCNFWPYAMYDEYYEGNDPESELFLSPYWRAGALYSPYYYSCSLIARPEYWDLTTRTGRTQLRPTRASEVRFPSQKGVLSFDHWLAAGSDRSPRKAIVAVAAGAARTVRLSGLSVPVRTGDGDFDPGLGGHRSGSFPTAAHTLNGVHGIDLNE